MENLNLKDISEIQKPGISKQNESSEIKKDLETDFYKNSELKENSSDIKETQISELSNQINIENSKIELESDFYKNVEKNEIRNETGWSDKIIDNTNYEQYEKVFKPANLEEKKIDGRVCLTKKDFDLTYRNEKTGETNNERIERGLSGYDYKTGEKIELHHLNQKADSPFVHLLENSEHGKYSSILHENGKESFRRDENLKFKYNYIEKPNHWKEFRKELLKNG